MGAEQSTACRRPAKPTQAQIREHCGPAIEAAQREAAADVERLQREVDAVKQELQACKDGSKAAVQATVTEIDQGLNDLRSALHSAKAVQNPQVAAAVSRAKAAQHNNMYAALGGGMLF